MGWGISAQRFSGVRGPNFTKLGAEIDRSLLRKKLFQRSDILLHFQTRGGSKLSGVENDAKFRTFWLLWTSGEGWARSLYQLLKLYLRPNLGIHLMAIHCAAAERGVLIKTKERKKIMLIRKTLRFHRENLRLFRLTSDSLITHPWIIRFRSKFVHGV